MKLLAAALLVLTPSIMLIMISSLSERVTRLESKSPAYGACAHGIPVMSADGKSAVLVCQP